ncbi:nitroreductase [Pseudomaricurvus alcaniphilus]|uniref:nitroreductase family protein n=1 Tax=Pseudomaricurvus alcaniphilus TaxID=1166482 RepID=UPI00140E92BD|nr:nitroreductase family protein [Pseudomaricurvus alcaniphilus]NHN36258.1 nitroreductase [Pseudomaricurvus alcaniphilus]
MQALDLLLNRVSCGKLQSPAPNAEQRQLLYRAAMRAADHASLQPWRFLEIEGAGLDSLGELFVKAAVNDNPQLAEVDRARLLRKPLRAPLIVVAIARYTPHPKVPEWEQTVAAGCATQNLINAAYAQGIGAYWRTGANAEHPLVCQGLGLQQGEKIIGFVYLGTPSIPLRTAPEANLDAFVQSWPAI